MWTTILVSTLVIVSVVIIAAGIIAYITGDNNEDGGDWQ